MRILTSYTRKAILAWGKKLTIEIFGSFIFVSNYYYLL